MTAIPSMTAEEYRLSWDPSEKEFQAEIIAEATRCGWLVFHDNDSRRNEHGFPDLVLIGNRFPLDGTTMIIFAELKTRRGRLCTAQRDWLGALDRCPGVRTYLWRPDQLDEIRAILSRRSEQEGAAA